MGLGAYFRKKTPATNVPQAAATISQSQSATQVSDQPSPNSSSYASSLANGSMSGSETSKAPWLKTVNRPDLMVRYIHKQCKIRGWTDLTDISRPVAAIKTHTGDYQVYPELQQEITCETGAIDLVKCAQVLNCEVLITVKSRLSAIFITEIPPEATMMTLGTDLNVQIIDTQDEIELVRKGHFACFVRDPAILLVWSDVSTSVVPYTETIEEAMVHSLWKSNTTKKSLMPDVTEIEIDADSLEAGDAYEDKRPDLIIISSLIACAIVLVFWFIAVNLKKLVIEVLVDHGYMRTLLLLYVPFTYFWSSFFAIVIIGFFFQVFGPISQLTTNSKYYSAVAPKRIKGDLPPITIQCPVYKESLREVIMPTVASLQLAVATYEMQGGRCNIFFNDDGMQVISEEEQAERKEFYRMNNIGWVARPAHGQDGFVRAGRFKKASNMNYALHMSMLVEDAIEEGGEDWEYQRVLSQAIEKSKEYGPVAQAAGDIRMGELILLVDSDTRVPADCLIDAASEFHQSPYLAILQHACGVMQVVHNFWENGITHFTNSIYFAIQYACASGDAAPFVGHNAFLRWSAIQEIAYTLPGETRQRWWSEEHVSEDFEMSLKVQMQGYIVRLAAYSAHEFKEGVSLTVYDELARWQKYTYGCSELVFNPFKSWFTKGPITPLFRTFLRSNMKSFAKFTMVAYISTYYAISAGALLTLINYFVVGWFSGQLDHFYVQSFQLFIAVVFVFNIVSPIANAFIRFRVKESGFFSALLENYKWSIMMSVFMGGLGIHLTTALLSHLFSFQMDFGATSKTLENSSFSREIPKIWKQFRWMYIGLFILILIMLALAFAVPLSWRISGLSPCICLGWMIAAHWLLPLVLNPQSYLSELHS